MVPYESSNPALAVMAYRSLLRSVEVFKYACAVPSTAPISQLRSMLLRCQSRQLAEWLINVANSIDDGHTGSLRRFMQVEAVGRRSSSFRDSISNRFRSARTCHQRRPTH